ncbi:MAG TPA: hypothetical protein VHE58_00650 [Burkholderiales bacterium]|nr:hypothetical protein [Burkholderiales bacterium]
MKDLEAIAIILDEAQASNVLVRVKRQLRSSARISPIMAGQKDNPLN